MTDTGQIPAEGLPENAGNGVASGPAQGMDAQRPDAHAPGAHPYLVPSVHPAEDDDQLLMPSAQGAWGEPQYSAAPLQPLAPLQPSGSAEAMHPADPMAHAQPAPGAAPAPHTEPTAGLQQAAYAEPSPTPPQAPLAEPAAQPEPGPHETAGRDSGAVDLTDVRSRTQHTGAVRRPLHMGPPVPDSTASPVRSLADRGPAGAPAAPQVRPLNSAHHPGPEYLDTPVEEPVAAGPQLGAIPPHGGGPWSAEPQPDPDPVHQGVPHTPPEGTPAFPYPGESAAAGYPAGDPAQPVDAAQPPPEHQDPAGTEPVDPGHSGQFAAAQDGQPFGYDPQAGYAPDGAAAPETTAVPDGTGQQHGMEPAEAEGRQAPDHRPDADQPRPAGPRHGAPGTTQPPYAEAPRPAEQLPGDPSLGGPLGAVPDGFGAFPASPDGEQEVIGRFVPVEGTVPTTPHLAPTPPHPLVVPDLEPGQGGTDLAAAHEAPEEAAAVEESPAVEELPAEESPAVEEDLVEEVLVGAAPVEEVLVEAAPAMEPPVEEVPPAESAAAVVMEGPSQPVPAEADVPDAAPAVGESGTPAQGAPIAPDAAPAVEETATPAQGTPVVPAPRDGAHPRAAVPEPSAPVDGPVTLPGQGVPVPAQDPAASQPEAAQPPPAPETAGDPVPAQAPPPDDTDTTQQQDERPGGEPAQVPDDEERVPAPPAPAYDDAEREAVLRVMRERRDIRNGFRADPIPNDVLLRILEAAHTAPSVGHSQPWDFVVIRSAETRQTMHELAMRQREAYAKSLPKGRAKQFKELKVEAILDTPVNIVITADPTRGGRHVLGRHTQPQMAPYSSALAVENFWLAARAEGLGVGWVSFFDERELVRALGLPEHLDVVAYLCVGYVDEFPEEPELIQAGWSKRRPLSWVVHEETYGRRILPGAEPHDLLAETVAGIRPLDAKALGEAWERQKRMTKPAGALGMLEIISAQLSGLSRMCPPPVPEPATVAVFAADHGVHAQGVTPWPQEVTGQMVANILGGGAVCNAFATQVGAEVCVVDVGVAAELPATPGLLPRKVRAGTADMTAGPAMTREEAKAAVEVGIETARDLVAAGNRALLTGEMGIANTTASAALISVFTGADPAEVTGRGTGINDETLARKTEVVRRALELHQPDPADPIGVLAALGGLEHAAIVGLLLGGASLRTPVVLDGVSAGAAALVAHAIAPEVLAACIAGHRSAEPGHVKALNKLGLRPLVDLDLRLGEGTGALLALPVIQSAARAMHDVATFDSAGVTEK